MITVRLILWLVCMSACFLITFGFQFRLRFTWLAVATVAERLFSSCDFELWPYDRDLRMDLDSVNVNQHNKYQRSFSPKVIVRTDKHTHRTDCSNWTTKVVGKDERTIAKHTKTPKLLKSAKSSTSRTNTVAGVCGGNDIIRRMPVESVDVTSGMAQVWVVQARRATWRVTCDVRIVIIIHVILVHHSLLMQQTGGPLWRRKYDRGGSCLQETRLRGSGRVNSCRYEKTFRLFGALLMHLTLHFLWVDTSE